MQARGSIRFERRSASSAHAAGRSKSLILETRPRSALSVAAIQVRTADDSLNDVVHADLLTDTLPGYAGRMPYDDAGDIDGCDNAVTHAALGLSNKTCQP